METWKITFLHFIKSLVLREGFLETDALRRAGFASIKEGGIRFVCKSVLRELWCSQLGNTFRDPNCSGDAGDDKLQLRERQGSSDRSQEQVLREKLAGGCSEAEAEAERSKHQTWCFQSAWQGGLSRLFFRQRL